MKLPTLLDSTLFTELKNINFSQNGVQSNLVWFRKKQLQLPGCHYISLEFFTWVTRSLGLLHCGTSGRPEGWGARHQHINLM